MSTIVNEELVDRISALDDLIDRLKKHAADGRTYTVEEIDCGLAEFVGDNSRWLTTVLAVAIQRLVFC